MRCAQSSIRRNRRTTWHNSFQSSFRTLHLRLTSSLLTLQTDSKGIYGPKIETKQLSSSRLTVLPMHYSGSIRKRRRRLLITISSDSLWSLANPHQSILERSGEECFNLRSFHSKQPLLPIKSRRRIDYRYKIPSKSSFWLKTWIHLRFKKLSTAWRRWSLKVVKFW